MNKQHRIPMRAFPALVTGSACVLMLVLIILGIEPNTHPPIHPKGLLVVFFFLFLTTGKSIFFGSRDSSAVFLHIPSEDRLARD